MGIFTLFNDIKRIVRTPTLEEESLRTIFGDVKLDLTRAPLRAGNHTLDLLTVFGDIKLRVPEQFGLVLSTRTIFSVVEVETQSTGEEERPGNGSWVSPGFDQTTVRISMRIEGFFGDVTIVRVATPPVAGTATTSGYEGETQQLPQEPT
jgi:predicted membrane protein